MQRLIDAFRRPSDLLVRRLCIANLVANIAIVVTGGAVRLTGSGLGCPTWPRCTEQSFTPHSALGVHGVIEFGNRLLTYVLVAIAIATWLAIWQRRPRRRDALVLATLIALGIPFQGVIGGITVLTDLNPWVVALHLMLSMGLITLATLLLRRVGPPRAATSTPVPAPARHLAMVTYAVLWVVVYVGTIVTGSGPHAGDVNSPRNGLDPATVSQLHADLVFLLVGLTVGCVFAFRALGGPVRAAYLLLALEFAQGIIGFVQYVTDLPELLVGTHLLGAAVLIWAGTRMLADAVHANGSHDEAVETTPPPRSRHR